MDASAPAESAASTGFAIARRRLLPLLFVLYVVAYLDRINIGFAALSLNRELAISSEQYGLIAGVFFFGYFLFEIPSNILLHRIGARIWIARILLSWGVVSLLTGFAQNATQLGIARFLLGVAEAGFFPGIALYLTYWLPSRQQAAAIGLFLTGLPAASVLGAPLSGWILDHVHALGLSSWRWLLILEALPAIVCGGLTYWLLPSRPADARFLSAAQRSAIEHELAQEAAAKPGAAALGIRGALVNRRVWWLAGCLFLFLIGNYVTGFWMPQAIKKVAADYSNTGVGLIVMIPNLVGLVAMIVNSRHSDRSGERYLHTALPLVLAAGAYAFVGDAASVQTALPLWCAITIGLYSFAGPFWAIPGEFLTGTSAAVGFAFICSFGNLGGLVGVPAVGWIAGRTGSLGAGFAFVSVSLLLAAAGLLRERTRRAAQAQSSAGRIESGPTAPRPAHAVALAHALRLSQGEAP